MAAGEKRLVQVQHVRPLRRRHRDRLEAAANARPHEHDLRLRQVHVIW